MSYPSKAIANYFLSLAKEKDSSISPLKLQKLVYYAHGWNLALTGEPLIDELIEAWEYGPVIPSLYHEFKGEGKGPIHSPATEWKVKPNGKIRVITPTLDDCPDENIEATKKLLNRIWFVYGKFSGIQLSAMTHEVDSPWWKTRQETHGRKNADIPDNLIREHFLARVRHEQAGK
jgi:uncharacterized phage-associated protein